MATDSDIAPNHIIDDKRGTCMGTKCIQKFTPFFYIHDQPRMQMIGYLQYGGSIRVFKTKNLTRGEMYYEEGI